MAHWFYIPADKINSKEKMALLADHEWRHAAKVLRLKVGDGLEFFDGQGNVYQSIISASDSKSFSLNITEATFYKRDYSLYVFFGIPKGQKIDLIIKALTEVGATEIGVFTSKYSVAKAKSLQKIERLRKIIIEACKQSQRARLPKLEFISFNELAERVGKAKKAVIFYEKAPNYLPFSSLKSKELAIAIGPEGGFAHDEVDKLKAKGAVVSRLSDAILRVETAAIAATSLARYAQLSNNIF